MCNTHFIKYTTFNQKQIRVSGECDKEKNLIENRQVFKEDMGFTRARDGTKKGKRKSEGKTSVPVLSGEPLMSKTLMTALPHNTALSEKVQTAWYPGLRTLQLPLASRSSHQVVYSEPLDCTGARIQGDCFGNLNET